MASSGTGVVIGSHSVKVVQARKKGGVVRLSRIVNVKLDEKWADRPMDAKKEEYIVSLLTGAGLKPGDAMLGVTGRDLIVRYTHVPPVPDWRLDMLMKFEIEEVSEQSGGEVCADWARLDIPDSMTGDNTILVALAKNQSLLPRIDILDRANLKIRGACPNAIGMYHAFATTAKLPPGEVTLLMHIGAENTDIAIQKDGALLFARNVSGGGRLFTEAVMNQFRVKHDRAEKMKAQKADVTPRSSAKYEDSLSEKVSNAVIGVTGQFVSMVHSSVMFCKAQTKLQDLSVDRVVLAGGGANLKGLPEYLSTNLGIPVEIFDPAMAVDASGLPPEEAEVLDGDGPGMTVALGFAVLAMDTSAFRIEILPEEHRRRRRFMERDLFMILSGALVALLIIILFWSSASDRSAANTEKNLLSGRIRDLNQQASNFEKAQLEFEAMRRKWAVLRDQVRTGPSLVQAVAIVRSVVQPEDGEGFDELHFSSVSTETVTFARDRDPNAPPSGFSDELEKDLFVKVHFRAEVQSLGRPGNKVFRDFTAALQDVVTNSPSVELKDESIEKGRVIKFTLWFAPPDRSEPEPSAEGE